MKLRDVTLKDYGFEDLKIDCSKCYGLCCVALYFSKCDGFPANKKAGTPCRHLNPDFTCEIHQNLRDKGLKGCTTYDCFGAGQKVVQKHYSNRSWQQDPKIADEMFSVFLVIRQLHEMLWYLTDALTFIQPSESKNKLKGLIKETEELTQQDIKSLLKLDVEKHRFRVNTCLKESYQLITQGKKVANYAGALLIAANLKNKDLSGVNFIGADMRDADIRGANLSESMFLTQSQVNVARGNQETKLPDSIVRPSYWEK